MQQQKRIKSMANFQKRKNVMKEQLMRAAEKLKVLEHQRALEIGHLAMQCGLAEMTNDDLEESFLKIIGKDKK